MGKATDVYHQTYNKFLLIDDFNAEDTEPCLSQFLLEYDSKNIASEKTCSQSKDNPCIDLFITHSSNFQNTSTIWLSDFHKMVITVLKLPSQNVSQRLLPTEILNCLMKKNLKLILKIL